MFKLRLFGKLYISIAFSSVILILGVMLLSDYTETRVSTISVAHQNELLAYAQQASGLLNEPEPETLQRWLSNLKQQEATWAAVVESTPQWLAGNYDHAVFEGETNLMVGRDIRYPIHLYYQHNPIMKLPLLQPGYNLLIQLPARMRPGAYWQVINSAITLVLPILLVALLSYLIYRHLISPLRHLQQATQSFSAGQYDVRVSEKMGKRQDELSDLAQSFDAMADRLAGLLKTQRQLIQDISHELRTPITRIKLVLGETLADAKTSRVEQEVNAIQTLVEDTLTLSWLETEDPTLSEEDVDVSLLIESIAEDAQFEFPEHELRLNLPETCWLRNSSHRALGQALENMIRNAHKYSPLGSSVSVNAVDSAGEVTITVIDQGPGVEPELLQDIFKPFFRVDKSRGQSGGGYGLGLALAKRQIQAIGGSIKAQNQSAGGLCLSVVVPVNKIAKEGAC